MTDLLPLDFSAIALLIYQKINKNKIRWDASIMLDKYIPELEGKLVNPDGTFTPAFNELNWGHNGSLVHRVLQGPERHGDVDGDMLEYYLSEGYLSKCSDWLRSMTPEVLREIEKQLWH